MNILTSPSAQMPRGICRKVEAEMVSSVILRDFGLGSRDPFIRIDGFVWQRHARQTSPRGQEALPSTAFLAICT